MTIAWEYVAKAAVSLFITAVLALQTVASLNKLHRYRYWPFLSYPMYNRPHYKGETVPRYSLSAVMADGSVVPITPQDLGLEFWRYLKGPVRAARDAKIDRLLMFLETHPTLPVASVVAVLIENRPVGLVDGKAADMPLETSRLDLKAVE